MEILETTTEVSKPQPVRNNKKLVMVIIVMVACFGAILYVATHATFATGKPYSVEVEGLTILPGKTTVQDLVDAGYYLSDYSVLYKKGYDLTTPAEAKTNYTQIALVKDANIYAHLEVANESSSEKTLAECIVSNAEFTLTYDYQNEDTISVNGVKLKDITPDKMAEISGKPYKVSAYSSYDKSHTGTESTWLFHAYALHVITLDDGSLYQVSSTYHE
ncbi:MAG TPA: hypothetical protein VN626_03470 [Clostridia bacterium]|nr:hypothetical protein [Clostridia bacterium]